MARGAICICEGGRRNVKISCARVGAQDSNTIAVAQRINGLILDMAYLIHCLPLAQRKNRKSCYKRLRVKR